MTRRTTAAAAALATACALAGSATADAAPGDILVSTSGQSILRIDPFTGARTILSGGTVGSGPAFRDPAGLTFLPDGSLVVADGDAFGVSLLVKGALFRVDPVTGARSVITSNSVGSGPTLHNPIRAVAGPAGTVFLLDALVGDGDCIYKVTVATGARSLVSCSGAPGTGPAFEGANDLAVTSTGTLLVTDSDFENSRILAVDPVTGNRSVVSSNTQPAGEPKLHTPVGLVIDAAGSLIVADQASFSDSPFTRGGEAVMRVSAATGMRALISRNTAPAGGPSLSTPQDIALGAAGDILVTDNNGSSDGGSAAVIRIDPTTGERESVSETAAPAGGPALGGTEGMAVQPGGTPVVSTSLKANPAVLRISGLQLFLKFSATLTAGPARTPLAGRTVRFSAANGPLCSAVTDATGTASCGDATAVLLNLGSYTATFDGGAPYAHSAATGAVIE